MTVEDFDPSAVYEISVSSEPSDDFRNSMRSMIAKLQVTQGAFSLREGVMKKICASATVPKAVYKVLLSVLKEIDKKRITEAAF